MLTRWPGRPQQVLWKGIFKVGRVVQAIEDGVFRAELNELLTRELAEDGYSGVTVRRTTARTDIIIRATRTQKVLGTDSDRLERS